MTNRARLGAAAGLALVTLTLAPLPADAAWWNPFRREEPQPQQAQPLPPPPAAVAPVPPAEVGQPTQLAPQAQQPVPQPAAQVAAGEAVFTGATPGTPEDMALRIERLEGKLRTMTGQIEELNHRVQQLEARLGGQQGAAGQAPAAGTAPNALAGADLSLDGGDEEMPMDGGGDLALDGAGLDPHGMVMEDGDAGPGAPPAFLGQVPADGPMDLSAIAGNQVASLAPATGSARGDYDAAYDLILSGDYQLAEAGFRQFLANYPDDRLAADAQYWLGESLFTRGLYREAAIEFLAGYRSYPDSPKAPDTLLKLGLSLSGLGEREQACNTFSRLLQQYPDANNALLQRVHAEQASASC